MLVVRLLWRHWRSGEVKILAAALVLAVAVVTAINVFAERLELSLVQQSHRFLAADRVVRSSYPIPESWRQQAQASRIDQAQTVGFSSMVFAGDSNHLAAIKAVSSRYPLRGELVTSLHPFAVDESLLDTMHEGPPAGEAWVDSRLLPLLNIELGDDIDVGEKRLTVTRVIIREPDRGGGFSLFGARVMMHLDDLAATEVVQPGSRVNYRWLLRSDARKLDRLFEWVTPQMTEHQQLQTIDNAQQGLSSNLTRGQQFMRLAAIIAVLLAGVAIAISSRQFARRHTDQVALLKSLGISRTRIRLLYVGQLSLLALLAGGVGLIIGDVSQRIIVALVESILAIEFEPARAVTYLLALMTSIVCLCGFSLPALWHLPLIPPLKILRRELVVSPLRSSLQYAVGLLALLLLAWAYSQSWLMSIAFALGAIAVIGVSVIIAAGLLWGVRRLNQWLLQWSQQRSAKRADGESYHYSWRLALSNIQRQGYQGILHIVIFASIGALLLTLFIVRTNLLEEWRVQLPENTPNHFLLNITATEVEPVESLLAADSIVTSGLYPIVRARLTMINQQVPDAHIQAKAEVLSREANLSWTPQLREDNRLVEGVWWDQWRPLNASDIGVSIEAGIAADLNVKLNDQLTFSVGGLVLEARVISIRELDWDSMQPNFYFLFSPNALDTFTPMYLTSAYLPPAKKILLQPLLNAFPTIVLIDMDAVIEQIRQIVDQVTQAVELVLWLVMVAGVLVMLAAINASMDERWQSAALLRALGASSRRLLLSLWLEFFIIGLCAGILAIVGAESVVIGLQTIVFKAPIQLHIEFWLWVPLSFALLISTIGVYYCRRVVTVAPMTVLREVA